MPFDISLNGGKYRAVETDKYRTYSERNGERWHDELDNLHIAMGTEIQDLQEKLTAQFALIQCVYDLATRADDHDQAHDVAHELAELVKGSAPALQAARDQQATAASLLRRINEIARKADPGDITQLNILERVSNFDNGQNALKELIELAKSEPALVREQAQMDRVLNFANTVRGIANDIKATAPDDIVSRDQRAKDLVLLVETALVADESVSEPEKYGRLLLQITSADGKMTSSMSRTSIDPAFDRRLIDSALMFEDAARRGVDFPPQRVGHLILTAYKTPEPVTMGGKLHEVIDWNEIADRGLLYRINNEIMHPLGLAIMRDLDTGESRGALVSPDGKWEFEAKQNG